MVFCFALAEAAMGVLASEIPAAISPAGIELTLSTRSEGDAPVSSPERLSPVTAPFIASWSTSSDTRASFISSPLSSSVVFPRISLSFSTA